MAKPTLYLDIFAFNLHKIKKTYEVSTPTGGTGTRYSTAKENIPFEDFFKILQGQTYEEKFRSLIDGFIGKFNLQYVVKKDKGISMNHAQRVEIRSKTFVLWGEFNGGHTGREQKVFNNASSGIINSQSMPNQTFIKHRAAK